MTKLKIEELKGWVLISQDDDSKKDQWHIAWIEPFNSKKRALEFAASNHWPRPYRAVRGRIAIGDQ